MLKLHDLDYNLQFQVILVYIMGINHLTGQFVQFLVENVGFAQELSHTQRTHAAAEVDDEHKNFRRRTPVSWPVISLDLAKGNGGV